MVQQLVCLPQYALSCLLSRFGDYFKGGAATSEDPHWGARVSVLIQPAVADQLTGLTQSDQFTLVRVEHRAGSQRFADRARLLGLQGRYPDS